MAFRHRFRRFAGRLTTITCLALALGAAPALASCPTPAESTPFAQWGDTNSYFLVPGGSFEGSPDEVGWSLWNASLTPGNDPFYINSSQDSQSLTVNGGGGAISPTFCLDNTMSALRFVAQQDQTGTDLQVNLLVYWWWRVITIPIGDLADGTMSSWAPTGQIGIPAYRIPPGYSVTAALEFVAPQPQGSWQIDDVFVDPYRSG